MPGKSPERDIRRPTMHFVEPWAWAWMIVWTVVLIGAVWLIVRTPHGSTVHEDAHAILRARFAKGEISRDEFERARDGLLDDDGKETR